MDQDLCHLSLLPAVQVKRVAALGLQRIEDRQQAQTCIQCGLLLSVEHHQHELEVVQVDDPVEEHDH